MRSRCFSVLLVICFWINEAHAQEQLDRIVKLDGTILRGSIMNIDNRFLHYSLPGRMYAFTILRSCVHEVKYSSGRVELITPKVLINSSADWKLVRFTANPADTECLQFQGVVEGHSKGILGFLRLTRSDIPLVRKIKKQSARKKAHIIYLTEPPSDYQYQSWQFSQLIYGRCFSY